MKFSVEKICCVNLHGELMETLTIKQNLSVAMNMFWLMQKMNTSSLIH